MTTENNKAVVVSNNSLLFDTAAFEHAQRVSQMLAASTMVPQHFRENIGNCVIALNYAHRAGIDPFMAMQKMYVIHGKPAIETQLQIALFNKGGQFSPLKYKMSGSGDAQQCIAYATDLATKEVVDGPPVSIAMAKAEGWYSKSGSKWKTLPELMLRYRAAAFFIRLYSPETTMGLHTPEELHDMGEVIDVTPDQAVAQEVEANANQEPIDITPEKDPSSDVEKQDVAPQERPGPDGMTDAEKAEIKVQERAEAEAQMSQVDGPGF